MKKLIEKIYYSQFFSLIFPTTVWCLQKNLSDCESVLDLGCGSSSPLQYCDDIKYSIGVEAFTPYFIESRSRRIHTKYLNKKIEEVDFPEKSFDAVILIEVLEHLSKEDGNDLLERVERWAKKKIIVSTPNGFWEQNEYDENPFQRHLSGWSFDSMQKREFVCWGLAGFKWLHGKRPVETRIDGDFTNSIRFRPRFFWFAIAALSQIIAYRFPKLAFGIFCVKKIK